MRRCGGHRRKPLKLDACGRNARRAWGAWRRLMFCDPNLRVTPELWSFPSVTRSPDEHPMRSDVAVHMSHLRLAVRHVTVHLISSLECGGFTRNHSQKRSSSLHQSIVIEEKPQAFRWLLEAELPDHKEKVDTCKVCKHTPIT